MSVADHINEALEAVESSSLPESPPSPRDQLAVTAELPAVCASELALSTYFNDQELARTTWEHAVAYLGELVDPESVVIEVEP